MEDSRILYYNLYRKIRPSCENGRGAGCEMRKEIQKRDIFHEYI